MELDTQTERLQPNRWTFTEEQIGGLVHTRKIEPWAGSPLILVKPSSTARPPSLETEDIKKVNDAILRISRPDIILGMLHYPPETPDVTWFYGAAGDKNFAVYRKGSGDDHHIVWPVTDKSLMKVLEAALAISEPAAIDGFSLSLNRAGFETLVAIVDLIQEETLFAVMNRQQQRIAEFNLADLFECYKRSLLGLDFRWMAQRAKLFSPSRIMPEPEYLRIGLNSLVEQQMLVSRIGRYGLTQRFYTACSLMGACSGFCGLSTRRLKSQPDAKPVWDHQHVAALRGTGSLWLFDFSQITTSDFIVRLGDVTPGLLQERLHASMLTLWKPSAPSVAPTPPPPVIQCPHCGTQLSPENKFCTNCGRNIVEKKQGQKHCVHCGGIIQPRSTFCPQCGTSLKKVDTSPLTPQMPQVLKCSQCGASLSPKNKFCTKCGSSVK
jgi:uncharacterized OB-fold protein